VFGLTAKHVTAKMTTFLLYSS